jgi:hypothetical protein
MFLLALTMAAIVGAAIAWKYATWNLYRRPGSEWATDQIDPRRINRRLLARRKRHRLQMSLMAALLSPMLVYALLSLFDVMVELSHTR